jgi:hypothetical protein
LVFFVVLGILAEWRNRTCGYDCGILPLGSSGVGPPVVAVGGISILGALASIIALVFALVRHRAEKEAH